MIDGKRLVVVTPAGRRRYLEILAKYVLRCPEVDRWDLWMNTEDAADIAWMDELEAREPRVSCVRPDWEWDHNESIAEYYRFAAEPDTVYVRLDDDVVWVADGAIAGLARHRLEDPNPVVVYGNVFNTSFTNAVHQRRGHLTWRFGPVQKSYVDPVGWGHGEFAREAHEAFLRGEDRERWSMPNATFAGYDPQPVIAISWLGSDMADWWPEIREARTEEMTLAHFLPERLGRPNVLSGRNLFVHYATWCQRAGVDLDPTVLYRYRELAGL